MRRTFIIIASVIFLLAVGFGGYFFFVHRARVVVAPRGEAIFPTSKKTVSGGAAKTTTGTTSVVVTPVASTLSGSSTRARLVKITSGPVVPGVVVFDTATTTATTTAAGAVVRYIERKSGNVYSYTISSGMLSRLSNKTIPGVEQAVWLSDGSLAYLRYLSTTNNMETYALPASGVGGFFFAQGISGIAADGSKALLATASGENGSIVTQTKINDTSPFTAFQTPLSSITVSFSGENYLVYTKPSATIAGYAFVVNKKTGAWVRIAGPLDGLVAKASPNGSTVLISYVDASGNMQMELVTVATHQAIPLPVATIATKCVWAPDSSAIYCGIPINPPHATYPDNWYQGTVAFNDRIWKINVKSRYAQLVLDFSKETGGALDATALAVDTDTTTLSFVNKNNGSLWEYQL